MATLNTTEALKILEQHKRLFNSRKTKNLDFRVEQLVRLKEAIKENENRLLEAVYLDLHKSGYEAFTTEVGSVYSSIGLALKKVKKWAQPKPVKTPFTLMGTRSYVKPEPFGTVLIIGPFNYPINLVFEPLIGAIAAGNCAVIKPSELAPHVSAAIAGIVKDNFEPDYLRVVEGEKETTSVLINLPFDYIFFTGSPGTGKIVMEAAARNLVPVTLELGGKSPCIVDETADIADAAGKIAWGKFTNAGQTCVAPDYLLAHKDIKTQLVDSLKKCLEVFYGSNPKDCRDFGRIINTRHAVRLSQLIEKDKIVKGGECDVDNRYIAPTILDRVEWSDPVMSEEIFGPVLPVLEYDNLEQAIERINSRPKPLALYLFTKNRKTEKMLLDNVSFGGGCVNDTLIHLGNPHLPFGGVGTSGIGSYHGEKSFETFSHNKSILKRTFNLSFATVHPPYNDRQLNMVRKFLK